MPFAVQTTPRRVQRDLETVGRSNLSEDIVVVVGMMMLRWSSGGYVLY